MKKITLFFYAFLFLGINTLKAQIINTVVGNGTAGYSGDGSAATSAEIHFGNFGSLWFYAGNMYIADKNNNVFREVNSSDIISTIAGNTTNGYSGNGGAATSAELSQPDYMITDASGNLYLNDMGNHRIRKVNTSGVISLFAGNGSTTYSGDGGAATSAGFGCYGMAMDDTGNIYIADLVNNRIRKINTSGIITTIAGNGTAGFSGDGGAATSAELHSPTGVRLDASGNIYIADEDNNRIRKINTSGVISTYAGTGTAGYSGNGGAATSAKINNPIDMVIDASGDLYFTDNGSQVIRKINTSGIITLIAGTPNAPGFSGDGGQATSSELHNPTGLAFDASGNLYVADDNNDRVREIYLSLTVTPSATAHVSCNGGSNGSVSVTASNGTTPYTYLWSGGGTNSSKTGLTAGTYTITVTDHDGITGSAAVIITQPTVLSVSANTTHNVSYFGVSNGSVSATPSGGTTPYTYSWLGGGTNSAKTNLSAGTYTITLTDNNSCTVTASTTITQPGYLPYRIISPATETVYSGGSATTTLTACTQDSIVYRITENTPTSDTLYIKLPDGITYTSLVTSSDSNLTITHLLSHDTIPEFQIIPYGSTFKFTILVNTPSCNALHTSNQQTKIWAKGSNDTATMSDILSILDPELTVKDASLPNPISLGVGSVDEFVFALTDFTNSTQISKVYFSCAADPNISFYPVATPTYYLTFNSGRGLNGYYNEYTYNLLPHSYSSPLLPYDTIYPATINSLIGHPLEKNDTIYVHIPYKVLSCNDTNGRFHFYTVCSLDSAVCNSYTDTTHISINLGNPNIAFGVDTFDLASYCYKNHKDSSEFKFIGINRGTYFSNPPGNGRADGLKLFLNNTIGTGHIETSSIRINNIPISPSYITSYSDDGFLVYEIDLTHYPAGVNGHPFGVNSIQDLDGTGYADALAEKDTFFVTGRFIYDTLSCLPFAQCGNTNFEIPGIGAKYNNECFTIPGNDSRVDTNLAIDAYYQYETGYRASTVTAPPDILADSPFNLTICPEYTQDWGPVGFDFGCPHAYWSMDVNLPKNYDIDTANHSIFSLYAANANSQHSNIYEYLPLCVASGYPCSLGTDTLHPLFEEMYYPTDTVLVINFGRIDSVNCGGDYISTMFLPCINIPLVLDCDTLLTRGYVDTVDFTLQYTCDSACNNCSDIIACGNTTTYNHPCGPTKTIPFTTDIDLTIFRTNLGFINQDLPSYYTQYCSTPPLIIPSIADTLKNNSDTIVKRDAGYPGDQVETTVEGGYAGLTPRDFKSEYLQIRHPVYPGSPYKGYLFELDPDSTSYFIINGCAGVPALNGQRLKIPNGTPFYTDKSSGVVGSTVYMNFKIDTAIYNTFPSLYSAWMNDSITEGITLYAQLHLRIWNPNMSASQPVLISLGDNVINFRNEYMAVQKPGGFSADSLHSADSWGTRFDIYQPNITNVGIGGSSPSVCAAFPVSISFAEYGTPGLNGDFPNEFRPLFMLDSAETIILPAGYVYDSTSFYTNIDTYTSNSATNYFTDGTQREYFHMVPRYNSNPLGNSALPTTLIYRGLNNSCWPLVDQKLFYQEYTNNIYTSPVCNVASPAEFYRIAGYRMYTQQPDTNFQIHFQSVKDSSGPTLHVNPKVKIGIPPNVSDYSNQITFTFTLCDSGSYAATNAWVAFENPGLDTLNMLTATLTNLYTHQQYYANIFDDSSGVYFNLKNINTYSCDTLVFTAFIDSNSHSCPLPRDSGNGSLKVKYGITCNDTLNDPNKHGCEDDSVFFNYHIYSNDLELTNSAIGLHDTVSACGGLLVDSLTITSADFGTISDPTFWVAPPAGVIFDSVVFRHPCDGARDTNIHTPDLIITPSGGGNTEMGWDLNNDLKMHGLRGLLGPTPLNDSNTVCVKVYMTMSCSYSGSPIIFYTKGISTCSIIDSAETSITPFVNNGCCTTPSCLGYHRHDTVFNNIRASSLSTNTWGWMNSDTILIEGTFTVDENFYFDTPNLLMAPHSKIEVVNNSFLDIEVGGWIHAACDTMWRGIFVHPGSSLKTDDELVIEDADTAILAMDSGSKAAFYNCFITTFNKDYKDIVVQPYTGDYRSRSIACLYTCRNLDSLEKFDSLFCCGYWIHPIQPFANWYSCPPTTLLYPFTGQKTYMGWDINYVKDFYEDSSYSNTFDNLTYGIYGTHSNMRIYADSFRYIVNSDPQIAAITSVDGIQDTLIVGEPGIPYFWEGNGFLNCSTGVFASGDFNDIEVRYNHFYDSLTTPTIGVWTKGPTNLPASVIIDSNNIQGATVGVQCVLNHYAHTYIDSNLITGRSQCDSAVGVYISELASTYAIYNVEYNIIHDLHYGIYVTGADADTIYKNSILLTGDTGCVSPVAKGITIISGHKAQVVADTVSMYNYSNASDFAGLDFSGIYVENSRNCHMSCNIVNYVNNAIVCSGAADMPPNFDVLNNTMNAGNNSNAIGINLPNGSLIGFQGTPGSASDNIWNGTFSCNSNVPFPTILLASQFFVQGSSPYNPDLGSFCSIDIATLSGSASSEDCRTVPPIIHFDLLDTIARREINYGEYGDTTNAIAKSALTSVLWSNPSLLSEDTILRNFNDSISATSLGEIMEADTALFNSGTLSTAEYGYMFYTTPASNIETNMQTVGQIYESALASGTPPSFANIGILQGIANKCPYTDGVGVYQARTLLDYYTGKVTLYNDEDCSSHSTHKSVKHNGNKEKSDTISNISANIYPNPNNGNFTLAYNLGNQTSGRMELYNQVGMKIAEYFLTSSMGTKEISVPNLSNGLYIYKLYAGNEVIKVGKIIIMK